MESGRVIRKCAAKRSIIEISDDDSSEEFEYKPKIKKTYKDCDYIPVSTSSNENQTETKKKRGRPQKSTYENVNNDIPKRKQGRPKKQNTDDKNKESNDIMRENKSNSNSDLLDKKLEKDAPSTSKLKIGSIRLKPVSELLIKNNNFCNDENDDSTISHNVNNMKIENEDHFLNKETNVVKNEELDMVKKENSLKVKVKTDSNKNVSNLKNEKVEGLKTGNYWSDFELLAEFQNIERHYAFNIVKMLKEGSTIPFMTRYRKCETGNMDAEQLREAKENFDKIIKLKEKQQTVIKSIEKLAKLTPDLEKNILSSKSFEEIEHLYAPYKPGGKRTLAERAKALGLEQVALDLLENETYVNLYDSIKIDKDGLCTIKDVETGVMHIIAHKIANDIETLIFLREIRQRVNFCIEVKKLQKKEVKNETKPKNKNEQEFKFEDYFDFRRSVRDLKPHQVKIINIIVL